MHTPCDTNPHLAALLTIIATGFMAGTSLFAKMLGSPEYGPALHPLQISWGRFCFAFATFALAAAVLRPQLEKIHWGIHIGRSSFGWGGVTLMFAAVAFIPLADATAIVFLNPVFCMMLAIPLLGETVGKVRWFAAFMALVGAAVLLRPTPETFQAASLLALGAALLMGMELVFIKMLAGREPAFQVLLINNGIGLVIASGAAFFIWQNPTPAQWGILAMLGVCMASAQTCFINAMARADASFVAPFTYAALIYAAFYDVIFYGQYPDVITWIGAAIIIAGAVLLAIREARAKTLAPDEAST